MRHFATLFDSKYLPQGLALAVLIFAALITGCTEHPSIQYTGIVSNVRTTVQDSTVKTENGNGSAALGAYVGSVTLGGPIGAAVGAGLAGDNKGVETRQLKELIACSFTVTVISHPAATFRIAGSGDSGAAKDMRICSTLRDGDSIKVWINPGWQGSKAYHGETMEWRNQESE